MFIERLLNQGAAPVLEQTIRFSAARHRLIAENIANIDTPGYRHKDLSVEKFQKLLADCIERRNRSGGAGGLDDIAIEVENPTAGILFHDGNNRSIEQLATNLAKNAMMHNIAIELLRKQFQQMELALRERIA